MVILVTAVFILLAFSDFPKLIKSKRWKTVAVLAVFYGCVITMSVVLALNMTLPSPFVGIEKLITNLGLGYPTP